MSPPKPSTRRFEPVPGPPIRALALALFAVVGSAYAIVRHYTRPVPEDAAPTSREIPAPELTPVDR